MKTRILTLIVAGLVSVAATAEPELPVAVPADSGAKAPATAPEFPASPAPTASDGPPPAPLPQPVTAQLSDGSTVEFAADGMVWVVKGGRREAPPDGTMSLKDGTPFVVRNGKRVEGE